MAVISKQMRLLKFLWPVIALTLTLVAGASGLLADQHTLGELNILGTDALARHSLAQAEGYFREALARLPKDESTSHIILYNRLGQVLQAERRFPEAESEFSDAVAVSEHAGGSGSDLTIISLGNLASVKQAQGQLQDSRQLLERANALLSGREDRDPELTIGVWMSTGLLLTKEHQLDAAKRVYARAVELAQQRGTLNSALKSTLFINTGLLHFESGEYLEAAQMYRRALSIEKIPPFERAVAEHNLGGVIFSMGDLPNAEQALKTAVELGGSLDQASSRLTESLTLLGLIQAMRGETADAEITVRRAFAVAESWHADDVTMSRLYNTAGVLAQANGDRSMAKEDFERSARLAQNKDDQAYATALKSLGKLEHAANHHGEAEALYRQELEADRASMPGNRRKIATDLCDLAAELYYRKRLSESRELYTQADNTLSEQPGLDDADLAHVRLNLGILSWRQKQWEDAQREFSRAVNLFQAADPESPDFVICLRDYARVLRSTQHFAEAEEADVRATNLQVRKAIREQAGGEDVPILEPSFR